MHLEGSHHLQASPQVIWAMLMDPEVLAKVIPSVTSLAATGEGAYHPFSEATLRPVSGAFKGTLEVTDPKPPSSFTLLIEQNSHIGNLSARGNIQLNPMENQHTEVVFTGDVKLTGTLARAGQRVIGGVAKTLTEQFFSDLEQEICAKHPPGEDVPLAEKPGVFARIIAWFKPLFRGSEEQQITA
jgi:hypothetical protein